MHEVEFKIESAIFQFAKMRTRFRAVILCSTPQIKMMAVHSATDLMKLLQFVSSHDCITLKPELVGKMFNLQLTCTALKCRWNDADLPLKKHSIATHPSGMDANYGFWVELAMSDKDIWVKAVNLSWSGLPNILWSVGRRAGLFLFSSLVVSFSD